MEFKKYRSLNFQGNFYNEADLKAFCREELSRSSNILPSWEKSIYVFLLEWLDKKDYVEVSTSGSTGKPKIIRLSKVQMISSALRTGRYLNLKKDDKSLLCLPVNYIAGKMMIVRSIVLELNLMAVNPSSKPLAGLTEKPDFVALIPLQISEILKDQQQLEKLSEIRNVIIGGGRLDHLVKSELKSMPNNIYESYGMTETSTHIAVRKINGSVSQKYFQVLEGVRISQDQRRCLQIETPEISDKLILTNDLVEIINDHEFDLLGRIDHVINSGGIKYIPELIEDKLMNLISEPFVIAGEPDKSLGERLILVIESETKSAKEQSRLLKSLKQSLDKFEMPRKIYFIKPFAYTETGKINRKKVLQSLKKEEKH